MFHVTLLLVSGEAVSLSGVILPILRTPWLLLVLQGRAEMSAPGTLSWRVQCWASKPARASAILSF